jgi:preprotein translocase subunit SecF
LCTLTGWLKTFVNGATFLFVAILSVPAIAETANRLAYLDYIGVVVASSIFIGASAWLMNRLRESRSRELPASQ